MLGSPGPILVSDGNERIKKGHMKLGRDLLDLGQFMIFPISGDKEGIWKFLRWLQSKSSTTPKKEEKLKKPGLMKVEDYFNIVDQKIRPKYVSCNEYWNVIRDIMLNNNPAVNIHIECLK